MLEHATAWIELALRWLHVVTGAAWIGTSFYFNWLNNHVRASDGLERGVAGDLWSVHGGRFYRVVKYELAPERLPDVLHWFKWEAYFTWISGFCLLWVAYYLRADAMVVDVRVRDLAPATAIAIGVGTLVVGWVVYDVMCRSPLAKAPVAFALLGFALSTFAAYALVHTFGSRAAYIHVGAMLGTIMAANVFFVIIPNQRVLVAALVRGDTPDAAKGKAGALRSLHNNYLTLPVLFVMVSSHYPMTYGHAWNWAILAGISLAGAGVRHWFNLRGQGHRNAWLLPAAAAAMVALAFVTKPASYTGREPVPFATVRALLDRHCVTCHSATPTSPLYPVAPLGTMLDTADQVAAAAARINAQVVVSKVMPLANLTGMTDAERDLIGAWFYQGAPVR